MSLAAGTKLGPYEIESPAGAGGMGEVYRARDTRLDRTVAIKILPTHLAGFTELKQRFEREAKAISSLNHPHICHLYDVGSHKGTDFLVMEYVEGETLAERLRKGPLPLDLTLKTGTEIADALDKAHRQGIVHRDLKPGNIMLTKSGAKLMDFGLAKPSPALTVVGGAATPLTPSTPTLTLGALALNPAQEPLTRHGTVVGTFQYMAPEVLQGGEADTRSDIFSFGCVLYEMAAGKPAFEGKTQISVLAAILEKEPEPVSNLQPASPPALDHVVTRCLAKDRDHRWQSALDITQELKWITATSAKSVAGTPSRLVLRRRERLAWIVAAAVLLLAVASWFWQATRPATAAPVLRASMLLSKNSEVLPFDMAFSPDGGKLAFVARSGNGQALWVRPVDSTQAQQLPGTEDARYPFWSPDGRRLGFFAGGKLRVVDLGGEAVITLADAPDGRGGAWNKDDTIVFAPSYRGGFMAVAATGGVPTPLTELDSSTRESSHRWPSFLPDGRHLLFYVEGLRSTGAPSSDPTDKTSGLYEFDLKTKQKKFLVPTDSGARFAGGYIVYLRRKSLMAQPFDPDRATVTGAPASLLQQQVAYDSDRWSGAFTVSPNGLLAYVEGQENAFALLQWIDRSGKALGKLAGENFYRYPALSPDGSRVAVAEDSGTGTDIWIIDLQRQTRTRLTFDGGSACPVWSPDGKRVAYSSDRGKKRLAFVKDANGLGSEEPISVPEGADQNTLDDWSRDGRALLLSSSSQTWRSRLFVHWIEPGHKDSWLLPPGNAGWQEAAFSSDGKWVAYSSDESGRLEIYVVPFPEVNGKFQISTNGGAQPRWRADGKELFYVGLDRKLMAVSVSTRPAFYAGIPQVLFGAAASGGGFSPLVAPAPAGTPQYDVTVDGKRFLVSSRLEEATSQPITIVANWAAELKK